MKLGHVNLAKVNTARKQRMDKEDGLVTWTETTITLQVVNAESEVISALSQLQKDDFIAVEFGNQLMFP